MADPWRYRNKMEYSFGRDGAEIVLGMHRRGSWRDIVDVPDCHLAPIAISRARTAVLNAARELGLPAYSQIDHTGLLRHLVVRRGLASGDLLLNLFVTQRFPQEEELAALVAAEQPFTSFAVTVNATQSDAAVGAGPFMIVGPPYFHEEPRRRAPARAGPVVPADQLRDVRRALRDRPARRPAAGRAARLRPLLRHRRAQPAARSRVGARARLRAAGRRHRGGHRKRRAHRRRNLEFVAADVRLALLDPPSGRDPEIAKLVADDGKTHQSLRTPATHPFERPAVVLTDPPRAGMAKKAVERMALLGAERIVYVSCNPTTLAANAAQLAGIGYRLETVTPVDMFPHTHHIEAVATFVRV